MKQNWRQFIAQLANLLWHGISHRFWYKLLSVVIAVLVWSYALSSNPNLLREKWLDVDVRITGQSALSARRLALLTDVSAALSQARVYVSVPQQSYQSVTAQNVSVELDLSMVRSKGKQVLKLRGSTVWGSVLGIQPAEIELEVDQRDSRNVPVSIKRENERDDYWYYDKGLDPERIPVSGPSSIVRRIAKADLAVDLSQLTSSQNLVLTPVFTSYSGEVIDETLLEISTSSVTANLEIFPKRSLPVSVDIDEIITGSPPTGYEFDGDIEIQPQFITIAGDPALVGSMSAVRIRPVDITGKSRTFTQNTPVDKLADIRYYSSDNVNVKVDISEKYIDRTFSNCTITLQNLPDSFRAKWSNPRAKIVVNDLYSVVNALEKPDLNVFVDLSQIDAPGTYELPILLRLDNNEELAYSVEPAVARVTITDK